ncbi:MAG: DUF63 family protein [Candidatus Nanohaloarchaea archaeon]
MGLAEFFWKYLIGPIVADANNAATATWSQTVAHTGYNPVNTFTWALIAALSLYGVKKLFDRYSIKFTPRTVVYTTPFILLGGVLRFIEDTGFPPFIFRIILITPLIYFLIASLFLLCVAISRKLDPETLGFDQKIGALGTVLLTPFAGLAGFLVLTNSFAAMDLILPFALSAAVAAFFFLSFRETVFGESWYILAVFSQFFGGFTSMLSVSQRYTQKQLLAQTFTGFFGPPGILIAKALILAAAFYVVNDLEDKRFKALVLFALVAIGLGTGLRVALRMSIGV